MCLAIPALVLELHPDAMATVSAGGVTRQVSVGLLEDVVPGDYVLLHVGFALHKVSVEEAEETLRMMAQAGLLQEELAEWAETGSEVRA